MLFGTPRKLSECVELNFYYNGVKINNTTRYKYLGIEVDNHVNLNDHFESTYKKMSGLLRLLCKLRPNLTKKAAKSVYESMIVPLFLFNCVTNLIYTRSKVEKLASIRKRAYSIINNETSSTENDNETVELRSLNDLSKQHACILIKKCLDRSICPNFYNHFRLNLYSTKTRNQGSLLVVPKIRLESTKSSFFFMGVRVFNSLPIEIRRIGSLTDFRNKLKSFSWI